MDNNIAAGRIRKAAVSMLLILMLSFGAVLAGAEQTQADSEQDLQTLQTQEQTSRIFSKGKDYYYLDQDGSVRKTAGFVLDLGNLYYVSKGGKIVAGETFNVRKDKYRAYKNGVIATGIYKWGKKWYFSDQNGRCIEKECIVSWNDSQYYLDRNGVVAMNKAVAFNNVPYLADPAGRITPLEIPDGGSDPVVAVAKKQVGVMTGRKYWKWYFHSKFINTDRTPWCGTFVAWCYKQAGEYDRLSAARKYGNLGYVPSYSHFASSREKWISKSAAQPGDVVVFGKNRHVGIVEGISGSCLITIEGNAGPTAAFGCGKAGAVCRKAYKLSDKDIKGIVRP